MATIREIADDHIARGRAILANADKMRLQTDVTDFRKALEYQAAQSHFAAAEAVIAREDVR